MVLIDGHALVHRAFHALPPTMASAKGVLTNAVFGFTSVLIKMIKDLKPEYIVATFDLPGPTFRHEEFAEYKVHRQKAPDELHAQLPLVKEVLTAFGIPIFTKPGFEADDVIGALAEKAKKNKDLQVVIMTGDLDTLQLVDENKVVVFTLKKGVTDTVIYDEKEVFNRYGLKPSQVVDFKGLKGDPSDNIPGVPGIGEKTASVLIQNFQSIENLYKAISNFQLPISKKDKTKIKPPLSEKLIQKLQENKEMAFFSKKLATIIKDIDIDFQLDKAEWLSFYDQSKVQKVLQDLGFYSLIKRLDELKNIPQTMLDMPQEVESKNEPKYRELKEAKNITKLFDQIRKKQEVILHISGGFTYLTVNGIESIGFDMRLVELNKELKSDFEEILNDPDIKKIGHDLKELSKSILEKGMKIKGLYFDTKIAAYLLGSDIKDYALNKIYFNEFERNFNLSTDEIEHKYQPLAIYELKNRLWEKLKDEKLVKVFEDIEIPLAYVLAKMELFGIKVDTKSLMDMAKVLDKELSQLEKDIYYSCGQEFNINSPQQLAHILFEVLSLKGKSGTGPPSSRLRRTSKGALSTAASELDKLVGEHKVTEMLLRYRELQKLKTTYVDPFPNYVNKETSRLYTTFNQMGAATGRLSSQDPNIQNIPIRTKLGQEFRKVFVAEKSYSLISMDYSQLELRIAAHIAKDEKMSEAFIKGEDIHTRTAAEIYKVKLGEVTKEMRRQAKVLNFGLLYGMGILGFQRASGVSRDKAREFIQKYMEEFSGIAEYMSKTKLQAREKGYVSTIFGRKRKLPEINSGMPMLISGAERMAINMPIQGTAADLIKMAMIRISDLISRGYGDDAKMLLQVHDELLFEIKKGREKEMSKKIKDIMENCYKFDVPIVVDVKWGENWKDLKILNF